MTDVGEMEPQKADRPVSSSSDHDNDTFEDANDTEPAPSKSNASGTGISDTDPSSEDAPKVAAAKSHANNDHTIRIDTSASLGGHQTSTSSPGEADLDEDAHEDAEDAEESTPKANSKPTLPVRNGSASRFMGLSGALPSVPWSPPPPPPPMHSKAPQSPTPPPRKLTGPFSWLSRGSSNAKDTTVTSQTAASSAKSLDRRDTASSIVTIGSNPELMLGKLDEEGDAENGRLPARNSLRDRFKLVRLREEAGITSLGEEEYDNSAFSGLTGRNSNFGLGLTSPTVVDDKSQAPSLATPTTASGLAPGTAAGVAAGPSTITESVDWDLWQSVVYEGPAAVARTSPEELNKAIASGIPSAIRGVVWQVLAQSKNEELESVYQDLLARGTDTEKDRNSASSGATAGSTISSNGFTKDMASSASSVHSDDHSTLATSITDARSPSPVREKDADAVAKAHAAALAEKKQRAKDDALALQKLEKAIKRDLGARTSFSKFAASAGLQDSLFGVCKAYALFDEGVGYAQGINFLAMPILFNMPEEEAFCLLVRLMNQYHLRDLFIQDMPGLHMHLYQFERLLEDFEPALYCHLNRRQVTPHLYATQWFLTLFAYRFPLQLVLRIYDLILSEGLEAILKLGIVLMQKNAAALLAMSDMSALTTFLKDRLFDVYIDQTPSAGSILESGFFGSSGSSVDKEVYRADMLVQDACAVKITPELLKTYTLEWEEKMKSDAARETELDGLKSMSQSLALQVRRLEERVQDHDVEHATLATDLVRTKVENEELKDENEGLKVQVAELRVVVEKQPDEVEARLKSEMERLMKRNQEVHEDNTRLEEEMLSMEKSLVETKMAFAQVREENESMTQRLNNMRRALD